jgi:anti-anti-sigma factor
MTVERTTENGVPIFSPAGELDEDMARELCAALQEVAILGGERVLIDFGRVDFVQSAGLGVMFSCLSPLRGQCRIGFSGMDENIGRVLERVGFLEIQGVCFFDGLQQALSSFSSSRSEPGLR